MYLEERKNDDLAQKFYKEVIVMVKKSAVIRALKRRGQELYVLFMLLIVPIVIPNLVENIL